MQSYKLNLFFFIFLFPVLLFGQDPYYINYDTKDGLPSSEVYDVRVDNNGIAWFTTDRGICSYNGYEFKTFTTKDGLSTNTHLLSYVDPKGRIWFAGIDGTLTILENSKFKPFKWNDNLQKEASGSWLENLAWDSLGNLIFSIRVHNYIEAIDTNTGELNKLNFDDLLSKYDFVSHDSINFITLNGYYLPDSNSINSFMMVENEGHFIFLNTRDSTKVVRDVNRIAKISKTGNSYSEIKIENVVNLILDNSNTLWVCSNSTGLYRFDNADISSPPKHYFKNIPITSITKGLEGNYWVTSTENGVFFIPSFEFNTIEDYTVTLQKEKTTLAVPLSHYILFGSSLGEIISIDKNFEIKTEYKREDKNQISIGYSGENYTFITDIVFEDKHQLFPFMAFSKPNWYLKIKELDNGHFLCLLNRGFFVVSGGANLFLGTTSKLNEEDINKYNEYFLKKAIAICESGETIWLGTTTGLYSIKNYQYTKIKFEGEQSPLLKNRINDIKNDVHKNIWLATIGEGLLYKTEDTLFQLTMENGLSSNQINRIFVENDTTLWIASNRGLMKLIYNFKDNLLTKINIDHFNTSDGLVTNYINDITKWNGKIWLATNKGINFFNSETIDASIPRPKIILDEVVVKDSSYGVKESLILSYNQNDIFFRFTGISYKKPEDKEFYRYRLINENIDSTWYYTNNRDVRFNDLQAGDYTFEAAAQNKQGQWSKQPIIYHFSINPHFAQTWWFRILIIAILAFGIISFVRNRSLRIKFREEQKRKLQEAELKTKEAELQALRNQMNPHFVFNALNSIQNFVFKNDAKKANYYLSRFSKLMRDGLQFARLKYISLKEEIIFLNTYLELEKMRFPNKFQYKVVVEEDIPTNQYFIPPLLFQPILENAVKHAFKNIEYEGLLEIHFEENIPGELLKITILDNGEGFDLESVNKTTKSKNKSLGLEIIKNQIALLNSEGKDSKASFRIFNRKTLDPQQSGTQAEFVLSIKFSEDDQGSHH